MLRFFMGKEKVALYGVLLFLMLVSFQNCGNITLTAQAPITSSSTAPPIANPPANTPVDEYKSPFVNCNRSWKTSAVFDVRSGSDYGNESVIFKEKVIILKNIQNSADLYSPTVIAKSFDPKTNTFTDIGKGFSNTATNSKCYLSKLVTDSKNTLAGLGYCQLSSSIVFSYVFIYNETSKTWVQENFDFPYSLTIDSKGNLWAIQSRWNSAQQKYIWDIYKRVANGSSAQWQQQASSDIDSGYVPGLIISKKDEIFITTPKLTRSGPMHYHLIHVKSNQQYPIMEQLLIRTEYTDGYNYYQKGDRIYFTFSKADWGAKVVEFDFDKLSSRIVGEANPSVAQPLEVVRRSNDTLLMWSYSSEPDYAEFKTSDLSLVKSSSLDFTLNGQTNYFPTMQIVPHESGDIFIVGSAFYSNYNSVVRSYTCDP